MQQHNIHIYIYINAVYFANLLKSHCSPSFFPACFLCGAPRFGGGCLTEPPRLGRRGRGWHRGLLPGAARGAVGEVCVPAGAGGGGTHRGPSRCGAGAAPAPLPPAVARWLPASAAPGRASGTGGTGAARGRPNSPFRVWRLSLPRARCRLRSRLSRSRPGPGGIPCARVGTALGRCLGLPWVLAGPSAPAAAVVMPSALNSTGKAGRCPLSI